MTQFRLNYILLFALITAILTSQWTTTHIHLAEHHNHDGNHHQHKSEVHAHNSIDTYVDTHEISHQSSDITIVELDYEFSAQKIAKLEKSPTIFATSTFPQSSIFLSANIDFPDIDSAKFTHLNFTTVKPRAPPAFS